MMEKLMGLLSKKLATTVGISGGAMYYAHEVLQMVLAGTIEPKFGVAVVATCVISAALKGAVYTHTQGKIDLGAVYINNKSKVIKVLDAAEKLTKKKK